MALVTGAPGIGKSWLWSEFSRTLPEDWQTFQSNAHLAGPSLEHPFGRLVSRVDPSLPAARAIGHDLASVVRESAAGSPIAVCIEDVHFLDPVAVAALAEALDVLGSAPALFVATCRVGVHGAGSPWATALATTTAHPAVTEVRLAPLGRDDVQLFLRDAHSVDDAEYAANLHRRSGGVPLAMVELASTTEQEGHDLREALGRRVEGLPGHAFNAAGLLAIAAQPVPVSILTDLGHVDGVAVLEEQRLATTTVDGFFVLRHALVADVVLEATSDHEARAHHLALAEALAGELEPSAATVAVHFAAAGRTAEAAQWAGPAADRCHARGAHHSALRLYEIALAHASLSERDRLRYLSRASSSASIAGQGVETARLAAGARSLRASIDDRDQAARRWVNLLTLDVTASDKVDSSPANTIVEAANVAMERGDSASARSLAAEAHDRAHHDGDGATRATAALVAFYAGDFRTGVERLEALHRDCVERGQADLGARALAHLARLAWARGEVAESIRLDRAASQLARQSDGDIWAHYQLGVAYQLARCGALEDAEDLAKEALALEDAVISSMAQLPLAMVEFERGDLASCRARLDPLVGMARAIGLDQLTALLLIVVAAVETLEGDRATGVELAVEIDGLVHSPFHELQADRQLLLALGAEDGDRTRLDSAVDRLDDLARLLPGDNVLACADTVRGIRARAHGSHDDAIARFSAAAEAFERAGQWVAAAERWCDVAAEQSAVSVASAPAVCRAEALVAEHGLARVGRRLTGLSDRAAMRPDSTETLGDLTPRELDVLRLLGGGLTNREIADRLYLSENTVRNYLAAVFAKLGVHRRGEAIAAAHRAGVVS